MLDIWVPNSQDEAPGFTRQGSMNQSPDCDQSISPKQMLAVGEEVNRRSEDRAAEESAGEREGADAGGEQAEARSSEEG